ncbi:hypothetical protein PtB15_13B86 [Puccinia triticina]|nr:hypothetical protein PtB15_13B86 [Puccinia triticina]
MSNPIAETSNQLKASTELAVDTTQHAPSNPTPPDDIQPDPSIPTTQAPAAQSAPAPKTNPPRAAKTTAPKKATVKQPKKAKETPSREVVETATELGQQDPEIARALGATHTIEDTGREEEDDGAIIELQEDPRVAKERAADMILEKALKAQEEGDEGKADQLLGMWDKGKANLPPKPPTAPAGSQVPTRPAKGGYKGNQFDPNYIDPRSIRNAGQPGDGQLAKYR